MLVKAEQKYIRMSPRKLRLVVDVIRGMKPNEALQQLSFMRKAAALPVKKTIKQAMANAIKNLNISEELLVFQDIQIGKGPTYKRWRAVSRGRAHSILKRSSHIKVLLKTQENKEPKIIKQKTKKIQVTDKEKIKTRKKKKMKGEY